MNRKPTALMVIITTLVTLSTIAVSAPEKYTESITGSEGNKISFDMKLIPGGTFTMGSGADEPERKEYEGPRHKVQLDPFYLCTTETTLELFLAYYNETNQAKKSHEAAKAKDPELDAITGPTPVFGEITMGYSMKNPAMGMTWHNAVNFCKWLSKKTGKTYRLPTEAEWEYACRAGSTEAFHFGNDSSKIKDYAWFDDNSDGETQPVAGKKPNNWGLYDMLGNTREWVHDFYDPAGYKPSGNPDVNPRGPEKGKVHVARGGDFNSKADELRSAARAFEEKWWRMGDPQFPKSLWWIPNMDFIGFRIARSAGPAKKPASNLAFIEGQNGQYSFNTGIIKGTIRKGGKSFGLSEMVHIPTGTTLSGSAGQLSLYRFFTKNKRYGTAGWDRPSTPQLREDGSLILTWPPADDHPFEIKAHYKITDPASIDMQVTITAKQDLEDFELFVSVYTNKSFPKAHVYVNNIPEKNNLPGFISTEKSFGIWQTYPRHPRFIPMIKDGRWTMPPHPVDWTIQPSFKAPLCYRSQDTGNLKLAMMAPEKGCFAIYTPYNYESHYSMYMSLFGLDIKTNQSATSRCRLTITENSSDMQIIKLYNSYLKDIEGIKQ